MNIKNSLQMLLSLIVVIGFVAGGASYTAKAGSFDDDIFDDLAVGIPGEDLTGSNEGLVTTLKGSAAGTLVGSVSFHQTLVGGEDMSEDIDLFGSALAVGDFNCDGLQDLAVGVPAEDVAGVMNAGVVHVIYGQSLGLDPLLHSQYWYQGHNGLQGTPQMSDSFGTALAAGDFDGSGCDDLAIGVPNQAVGGAAAAGVVQVLYSERGIGLTNMINQMWSQDLLGGNPAEAGDHFGQSLTSGDFNNDGRDDLAVGVPGEDIASPAAVDAGAINMIYGGGSGFTGAGSQFIYQSFALLEDAVAEEGDQFGSVLATGDFNGDRFADLAIGIPYEDTTLMDAGAVEIFHGSISGIYTILPAAFYIHDDFGSETGSASEHFGWALAAGNFDGAVGDDLAIGVPDFDWATADNLGKVLVAYSNAISISTSGYDSLVQYPFGLGGVMEENDRLGYSLAAGNFNTDFYADLVIGVPYEDDDLTPTVTDAGAIHVVFGAGGGLSGAGSRYLYQGVSSIADIPQSDDRFGEVLAASPIVLERLFLPLAIK